MEWKRKVEAGLTPGSGGTQLQASMLPSTSGNSGEQNVVYQLEARVRPVEQVAERVEAREGISSGAPMKTLMNERSFVVDCPSVSKKK